MKDVTLDSADGFNNQFLLEIQIQVCIQGPPGMFRAEHACTVITHTEGVLLHDGVSRVGLSGGHALLLTITGQNAADRFKCRVFWMFAKGVEEFSAGIQLELPSILV